MHVYIIAANNAPVFDVTNVDCIINNLDPFQSLITITAGGQIMQGAVTNYTCSGNEISEFRSINRALSSTIVTALKVFVISNYSVTIRPNCMASNIAGSATLQCSFESNQTLN